MPQDFDNYPKSWIFTIADVSLSVLQSQIMLISFLFSTLVINTKHLENKKIPEFSELDISQRNNIETPNM